MKYTESNESIKLAITVLAGRSNLKDWKNQDEIKSAMRKISHQYTKQDIESLSKLSSLGVNWIADFVRGGHGKV